MVNLTVGANNLPDIYPNRIAIVANGNAGQFIHSISSLQPGANGRYLFGRIDIAF